jgi:hypothetical protein
MLLSTAALMLLFLGSMSAYYNVTYLNTTLILNKNQSAQVIENIGIYVSNASVSQYIASRGAFGLGLADWQKLISSTEIVEHIVNAGHSPYDFKFLPGPLSNIGNGGYAILTMNYYVNNVTTVKNIAPRKFEYTFNNSVFNFENTASGQVLPANTKLNLITPAGAHAVSLYPLPDSPPPNFLGNYTNATEFSWYTEEPLSKFSFSYIVSESLQDEVVAYFSRLYDAYSGQMYAILIIAVVLILVYLYLKSGSGSVFEARR